MQKRRKTTNIPAPIEGLLIDIDGVLHVEWQAIHGAVEAIDYLQKRQMPFMLVTNTTRRSRYSLVANLQRMGFKIKLGQIYSAPYAAAQWLRAQQAESINLFLRGDVYREFKDFRITSNKPQYLLIGDIGEDLTYDNLNQAFRLVMGGTKMVALQKNRYWQRGDGLAIDCGALVAALEYATRQEAILIGKPSLPFFEHAIKLLNLPPEQIAIIGDDIESDIAGGARAGLFTILVQAGKYRETRDTHRKDLPHLLLPSIAQLPEWLESQSV